MAIFVLWSDPFPHWLHHSHSLTEFGQRFTGWDVRNRCRHQQSVVTNIDCFDSYLYVSFLCLPTKKSWMAYGTPTIDCYLRNRFFSKSPLCCPAGNCLHPPLLTFFSFKSLLLVILVFLPSSSILSFFLSPNFSLFQCCFCILMGLLCINSVIALLFEFQWSKKKKDEWVKKFLNEVKTLVASFFFAFNLRIFVAVDEGWFLYSIHNERCCYYNLFYFSLDLLFSFLLLRWPFPALNFLYSYSFFSFFFFFFFAM